MTIRNVSCILNVSDTKRIKRERGDIVRANFKKERELRGLTQDQLAKKLNVSEVFVRKIESGSSNPSSAKAVEFAEFFQKPLDYLFPDIFLLSFDTKYIKNRKEKIK